MLKLAPAFAAAVLLASACGGGQAAAEGDALHVGAASTYTVSGPGALPPGVEVSLMLTVLRNTSGSDVRIRRVEPLGATPAGDAEAAAEVAGIELAVRDAELAAAVPLGFYPGARPAVELDGACVEQPTVPAEGFVLEPARETSEDVLVVLRVRTRGEGTFGLDGYRIAYERDGREYVQEVRDGLVLEVAAGAEPEIPASQARCAVGR